MITHLAILLGLASLAAAIGFSAHRAGLCTVRAMAEIIATRRAHMLASFFKSAVWVFVVATPAILVVPGVEPLPVVGPTVGTLIGGVLFGVGAVVNNGCAISTLTRLGGGDAGFAVTILGFAVGTAAIALLPALPSATPGAGPLAESTGWVLLPWAVCAVWAGREVVRLVRSRRRGLGLRGHLLADRMRLSVAALFIGVTNALLCTAVGAWAYTGLVVEATGWGTGDGERASSLVRLGLLGALLAGVTASAVARRSFRIQLVPRWAWGRRLGGGGLMGVGMVLVPGGNDALLMHALPALSPHAVPGLVAMLAGITVGLIGARRLLGEREGVRCRDDVCDRMIEDR